MPFYYDRVTRWFSFTGSGQTSIFPFYNFYNPPLHHSSGRKLKIFNFFFSLFVSLYTILTRRIAPIYNVQGYIIAYIIAFQLWMVQLKGRLFLSFSMKEDVIRNCYL